MDIETGYLLYAGLYRLAVIGAGVVSVVLGYRLFPKGISGEPSADGSGTSAEAKTGTFSLSVKNAAPGTCFALFGAALIVAMVVEAAPSLSLQSGDGAARSIQMKGNGAAAEWGRAKSLAQSGDTGAAMAAYGGLASKPGATASDVARVAAGMAGIYLSQGRKLEALAMARLAVQIDGGEPEFLLALAKAAEANGLVEESRAAADRAKR